MDQAFYSRHNKKKKDERVKTNKDSILLLTPNHLALVIDFTKLRFGNKDCHRRFYFCLLQVLDLNDNPPKFKSKDLALGVTRVTQFGRFILDLKVCFPLNVCVLMITDV